MNIEINFYEVYAILSHQKVLKSFLQIGAVLHAFNRITTSMSILNRLLFGNKESGERTGGFEHEIQGSSNFIQE